MNRRQFSKSIIFASAAVTLTSCGIRKSLIDMDQNSSNIVKLLPRHLSSGDTIGLIAPASSFSMKAYHKTVENLENLGFKVKPSTNLFKKWGYLAGTDQERVDDIHQMFEDDEIDGIWCVRGGYGTTRLLHMIDYNLIKNNPKALIGYSDITALLHAIYINTGLVGFHGPVGKSSFNEYSVSSFQQVVMRSQPMSIIERAKIEDDSKAYKPYIISKGIATGALVGGNLSLLSALVGTDNHWDARDKLIFIEDIEEQPYRIDRMLTQLLQGANLGSARGIILGVFSGCEKKEGDMNSLSLREVFEDRLGDLGIPVYYGFSFGHVKNNCTIPIGIKASFDTSNPAIHILEKVVS